MSALSLLYAEKARPTFNFAMILLLSSSLFTFGYLYHEKIPSIFKAQDLESEENNIKRPPIPEVPEIKEDYKYEELRECDLTKDAENPKYRVDFVWDRFSSCFNFIMLRYHTWPEGFLLNWPFTFYVCDFEDYVVDVNLRKFENSKKAYWAMLPRCKEPTNIVTIGVQEDQKAEKGISEIVGNLTFHGTHQSLRNGGIYKDNLKKVGNFTEYFENLGLKKIDMLWINLDDGNFDYTKAFNDGIIKKLNITVCQINLEVRKADFGNFHSFVITRVSNKFVSMRPMVSEDGEITKSYFLNTNDPECVRKYLQ